MRFKRLLLLVLLISTFQIIFSNPKIYLLTVGVGDEAYELYGHTGFRVVDFERKLDFVVDWGVFDFNQPDFYLNFARGNMVYSTSCWNTASFIYGAQSEGKSVISQEILLTEEQKHKLIQLIETNLLPENRDYFYDFIYENCATRPRDLLEQTLQNKLIYPIAPDSITFRQIINSFQKEKPWYNLIINIILGSRLDNVTTLREQMFIPSYLMRNLSLSYISDSITTPLLGEKEIIITSDNATQQNLQNIPLWFFAILTILIFFLDIGHKVQKPIKIFTYIFFVSILIISLLMIFLWGFTNHQSTYWNYNLLWANPLLIFTFIAYAQKKHKIWIKITSLYYIIFLIIWAIGVIPQSLPSAVVGIVLLLLERCYFCLRDFKKS